MTLEEFNVIISRYKQNINLVEKDVNAVKKRKFKLRRLMTNTHSLIEEIDKKL